MFVECDIGLCGYFELLFVWVFDIYNIVIVLVLGFVCSVCGLLMSVGFGKVEVVGMFEL